MFMGNSPGNSPWVGKKAPRIPDGEYWINADSSILDKLDGHVVLIDFWEYTCINCLRTLPYLRTWYNRYKDYGFIIIGVHSPEFDFTRDPDYVKDAVMRLGIKYPVVLDNHYRIWNIFNNRYWPRELVIDDRGIIRYDHAGEGNYPVTEGIIQGLLKDMYPDIRLPEPIPYINPEDSSGAVCYPRTPETYAGYGRGVYVQDIVAFEPVEYRDKGEYLDGAIVLNGLFGVEYDRLVHARDTADFTDYVAIKYHGNEVNVILRPMYEPYQVYVTIGDMDVPEPMRGSDIRNEGGKTFIEVDEPRMYNIIKSREYGENVIKLYTNSKSFYLYAFTFGSCTAQP